MINNNQLIEFIAKQAGLADITAQIKAVEYVRARATADAALNKAQGIEP